MDSDAWLARYRDLATLSGKMREAAREGRWVDVASFEAARVSLIGELKSGMPPGLNADERQQAIGLIAEILRTDGDTLGQANSWKGELEDLLSSVGTERKLSRTYGG